MKSTLPREVSITPANGLNRKVAGLVELLRARWERVRNELTALSLIVGVFLLIHYLPVGTPRFDAALLEALHLTRWYAREHVLLCLIPAFFIAGAIAVFVSQTSVMKYLGAGAPKPLAYTVASVSGTLLAVCSCTILPLFAGIYRMGAGLGPAIAFLYSGPAINVLAITLTASVLGAELGLARAVGAVVFSIVIGLGMHLAFRREELAKSAAAQAQFAPEVNRTLWQNGLYFAAMIGILLFVNWGSPADPNTVWGAIFAAKWHLAALFAVLLAWLLVRFLAISWYAVALVGAAVTTAALLLPGQPGVAFVVGLIGLTLLLLTHGGEAGEWLEQTWGFAKQILPLLLIGVLLSGLLLGRPGHEGLIPSTWVEALVGGNSLSANLIASVLGAFMYFATLTEVPILQGLIGNGMGKGPALALLLAGPALSLPNMLVIRSVIGTKKTVVYIALVVTTASLSGLVYGTL